MAKTKDENGDGGKTENVTDTNALIAQALQQNALLLQQMAANAPIRVITEDSPEYQARLREEGFFDTFPKPVFQNGKEAEARGLSAQTRERAAALRPGTYLRGMVMIEAVQNGGVHIKYKSRGVEDRMKYASAWKDFPDLVDQIWAEMHAGVTA